MFASVRSIIFTGYDLIYITCEDVWIFHCNSDSAATVISFPVKSETRLLWDVYVTMYQEQQRYDEDEAISVLRSPTPVH